MTVTVEVNDPVVGVEVVDKSVTVDVTTVPGAMFPMDENGNVIANVSHRTGTLADLLAVADAGTGEIAVATDVNAMVMYKAGSIPITFIRQQMASAFVQYSGTYELATDVKSPVPSFDQWPTSIGLPASVVDTANGEIDLSSLVAGYGGGNMIITATMDVVIYGLGIGDDIEVGMDTYSSMSNSWVNGPFLTGTVGSITELISYRTLMLGVDVFNNPASRTRIRFWIKNKGVTVLPAFIQVKVALEVKVG